jgi:hypothetical protein
MRIAIAASAIMALTACTVAQSNATADAARPGTCRNDALTQFTGQAASEDLGARMLAASGARSIRWVAHGMMVTMEFSPDRLTVYLDESNRVERASCG